MDVVNERSSWFVTASFLDEEGAPVTPSAGSYRIDALNPDGTFTEVRADTPFVPSSHAHDIEIAAEENAVSDQGREAETRVVTVTFAYGMGKQGTAEYRYLVRNLARVA
ncbi:MAG: hypothetical protein Kow0025_12000 [Thermodesulfovibrionales bacterium]